MNYLATTANTEYAKANECAQGAIEHARAAGDALIQAKGNMEHGQWLGWLANNWSHDERTAQRLMRLASGWEELANTTRLSDLSINDAMKLLANPPKPKSEHAAAPKQDKPAQPAPAPPQKPVERATSDDEQLVATLKQDAEEARQRAAQAEARLSTMTYANEGAENAAKRIMALEEENAALKSEVARLTEEVGRWKYKCKQLEVSK